MALLLLAFVFPLVSCGSEDQTADTTPDTTQSETTSQQASPESTPATKAPPVWIRTIRQWPDTVRWVLDSSFSYTVDDLRFRIRARISQDISGTRFQNEQPLLPELLMTVSPVPKWDYARTLSIDSMVIYDPVKKRRLPSMRILSFQRAYEDETVRTLFYANMADNARVSADLEDKQPLHPTLYLSWDKRLIIAELPELALEQVTDPNKGRKTEELPPDYRSIPEIPGG
ncbi:MAG: hypothetical protein Kow0074_18720 [Candidatus Zixiibacteriota bacterium]